MADRKYKVGERYTTDFFNHPVIEITEIRKGIIRYKVIRGKASPLNAFEIGSPLDKSLKKINSETIVIYRKDNEVTALDKSTGKKAIARCNPADEFDFRTGAKLAFSRLMGEPEENQQDKPKIVKCDRYEVGDKVLIRDWDDMVKEFGLDSDGDIRCVPYFVAEMKKFCNKIITVCGVDVDGDYYTEGKEWTFSRCMIAGKVVEESEKPVDEFKPYLEDHGTYGVIGEETPFKDAIGRPLRVGDMVEIYDSDNELCGKDVVVSRKGRGAFVMGIEGACGTNGEIGEGFKIILKRKHEEIADGETVGSIKYIKSQK